LSSAPPSSRPGPVEITGGLAGRRAEWRGWPAPTHLVAVGLLAAAVALRWWPEVSAPAPLNDEMIYFRAFRDTLRGASPFDRSGYLSFSLLAHLGGFAVARLGEGVTLALMRALNLLGVSTVAWCAVAWVPGAAPRRWLVAALLLVLSPAVAFGVFVANLSLVVSGLIVLALVWWPRRPAAAGALIGASLLGKPLAPGAVLALVAHRPAAGGRAHLIASGIAAAVGAAVALGGPELDRAVAIDVWPRLARTASPHRLGYLLDLPWSPPWISAGVAFAVVVLARRCRLGETRLLALAVVASVATVPVVWSHTLLLTLPLQVLALAVALERFGSRPPGAVDRPRGRRLEPLLVVLAVLALQLAEGITGIDDQPAAIQWLGALPPILAPWSLLGYVLRHTTDDF
jgi:hypothetical protein